MALKVRKTKSPKSSKKKIAKRNIKKAATKRVAKKKRNPGGGWEFKGKQASQWRAYREYRSIQEAQDKEGDWWMVLAKVQKRTFDDKEGLSKGPGIVNILSVLKESDKKYNFIYSDGKSAPYKDWRIGYLSQGPEVQHKDGTWTSVNVRISGNTVEIYDIRYDVKD